MFFDKAVIKSAVLLIALLLENWGLLLRLQTRSRGGISTYPNTNILILSYIRRNTPRLLKFSSRLLFIHHENYFHGKPGEVSLQICRLNPLWVDGGGVRGERRLPWAR